MVSVAIITNTNVDGTQFPSAQLYSQALLTGAYSLNRSIYPQLSNWDHYLALNGRQNQNNIPVAVRVLTKELKIKSISNSTTESLENSIITTAGIGDLFHSIHPIYQRKLMYNCIQFVGFLNCAHDIMTAPKAPNYDYFLRLRPDIQYSPDFRIEPYLRPGGVHLVNSQHPRIARVTGMASIQHSCPGRRSFVRDQVFVMTPDAVTACHANISVWLRQMISDMVEYWDINVERPHQDDRWYSETAWGQLLHISNVSVQSGDSPNQPGKLLRAKDF